MDKTNRLSIIIFSIGVCFSPMSKLRLPSTSSGIGELLIILSLIIGLLKDKKITENECVENKNIIKQFFEFNIIITLLYLLGTSFAIITNKIEIGSTKHNFAAYFFYLSTIIIFLIIHKQNKDLNIYVIKTITICIGSIFMIFAYCFLTGQSSFLGIDLFYELRFSGFSLNPNQLAFICIPIPFLSFYFLTITKSGIVKLMYFIFFVVSIFVGLISLSDALMVSWISGVLYIFMNFIFSGFLKSNKKEKALKLFIVFLLAGISLFFLSTIIDFGNSIYGNTPSNNQGSDRLLYWVNAIKVALHSPIFGFGPGSYSGGVPFGGEEAHNTFLDWFVSVGIVGLLFFVNFIFGRIRRLHVNKLLVFNAILISICIFSLFHLTTRHFLFWIMFLFL